MSSVVIFLIELSHWKSQFQEVRVRQNKNLLDEVKKHSRTIPDVQFKNFSLTKQNTIPRTDNE